MSTISTTSKTSTNAAAPVSKTPPKPVAAQTVAPAKTSPQQEVVENDKKGFKSMSAEERNAQAVERVKALLKAPIFFIRHPDYQKEAVEHRAVNISKKGGHFYRFPELEPHVYLLCQVKYGAPFSRKQMRAAERKSNLLTLMQDLKDAEKLFPGKIQEMLNGLNDNKTESDRSNTTINDVNNWRIKN